jgi:hypothetical protein
MASNPRAQPLPKTNVLRFVRKWAGSIAKNLINGHKDKPRKGPARKAKITTKTLVEVQGTGIGRRGAG